MLEGLLRKFVGSRSERELKKIQPAIEAVNAMVDSVDANVTLHICYGNRYGKPSFEGSYKYLFPAIASAKVHAISLEFARRGDEDLQLFEFVDESGAAFARLSRVQPPAAEPALSFAKSRCNPDA